MTSAQEGKNGSQFFFTSKATDVDADHDGGDHDGDDDDVDGDEKGVGDDEEDDVGDDDSGSADDDDEDVGNARLAKKLVDRCEFSPSLTKSPTPICCVSPNAVAVAVAVDSDVFVR